MFFNEQGERNRGKINKEFWLAILN